MTYANPRYQGNLQERLRALSSRTNCPTRQENGQRYLGPPVDWSGQVPVNSEVFISKLPADCFEDEIYDFCSQVGKIYLLRLMINFENENRGFCFVTYSEPNEAATAVNTLPQKPLRRGLHVHAEISLNNCTLKMYGLDFRWKDDLLEQEIRANTKDVVNVTIRRNMSQRTLMATLYFDTHQRAAIARRKLSQIANSRWGQNVKVFLWSKKLQNKNSNKQNNPNDRETRHNKAVRRTEDIRQSYQFERCHNEKISNRNDIFAESTKLNRPFNPWLKTCPSMSECDLLDSLVKSERSKRPSLSSDEMSISSIAVSHDANDNAVPRIIGNPFVFPSSAQLTDAILNSATPPRSKSSSPFLPLSDSGSPGHSKPGLDPYLNWNTDMFPKPVATTLDLDLHLPFEFENDSLYTNENIYHDKNIEIILQEALQALASSSLNEPRRE